MRFFLFFAFFLIFCQTGIENAAPRWGKNSKLVLVSLLLTGLLLAALLVAGYYLKTHRKNSKGVRLVSIIEETESCLEVWFPNLGASSEAPTAKAVWTKMYIKKKAKTKLVSHSSSRVACAGWLRCLMKQNLCVSWLEVSMPWVKPDLMWATKESLK